MKRKAWLWGVLVAVALVATARGQSGVVLSPAVAPSAAQPGVHTVAVTGSGFPAGAIPSANVTVTLVPASGTGTSATTPATGVQLLFAGTRRVGFQIPTTIAVTTPTAYRVSIAGTTGTGTAFSSAAPVTFTINPPSQIVSLTPASPAKGATTAVQMVTQYTDFAAGVTVASFGAGASVGGGPEGGFGPITVTSATTATALVAMNANAAAGARAVTVATGVQTATLAEGVTVAETAVANQAPHIASAPGTAATVLQPYTYQATATDADNDTLTWALTVAPSGMTIAQATGAVAWTPPAALAGTHAVTVQVTDGKGGLDTQSYSIVVAAARVNQSPHITTTPGTAATAGQAYSYAPAATDTDGDTLTWTLTQSPAGMAVTPGTGALAWTPGTEQVGAQTVTLSVSDGHGGTDSQTFAIAVARPANRAPRITSSAVTSGRATAAYAYTVTGTDPDNDPLTFALTAAPSGMTIDAATGAIAWTPTVSQVGPQSVVASVGDGWGGTDTQSFSITVAPPLNTAPTPRITGPTTGTVSQSLAFDASTSSDPDSDTLTYAWAFGDGATATGAGATHSYATSGAFTVTLAANDGHGHTPTATRSVVVSPPSNRAPVAAAGGPYSGETLIPVTFTGTGSSDPDGDALTYSWSFGDQAIGTGASPSHAYAAVGTYTVTLTVTDSHQTTSSATTSATVAAAADRAPPLVTLAAPRQALPGATVTVTVGASDNDRVSSVVLTIEGETPTTFTAGPYSRTYTLPAVAAPGSLIHLSASATDPSSNTGQAAATITVAAQPDTEPPTATLTAPPQAAPGTTVTLSADAHDNVGVAGVAFTVDGAPIGTVATPPYLTTWTVPSNATAGTVYSLVATASDAGGLTGTASASLTVVAVASASADPSVTLTVPTTVPAGGTVDLSAVAIADPTVVSVAFTVDGARLATIVTSPYATRYTVPTGLRNGATLQVQAEVTDGLGRTARDTKTATVQAGAAPGMGVLYGRVFDDTTGLAIANATVALVSTSITATTDAQGRYTISASEGPGTLRVTKNGWSRVDRPVTFVAGSTAFRVVDARLTPLAAAGTALPSVVGGTVSRSGWSLVVPGGALNADTAIALTSIGGQGLQGRLPLGWSPVATVDVTPHGAALAPAATLKAPAQTAPGTFVLARWDETASAWRAVTTATGTTLEALVVSTGQYAWLRADVTPAAPAMPTDGALLDGVAAAAIPEAATTRVTPDPKILFYSPGVFSTVTGIVTSPSALPSGMPLTLALNEVYHFLDGTNASPERVTQDLVAYQSPTTATDAQAVFPATPSLTFEAIALRDGVITAALYTQGAETGVPLLGAAGGVVNGPAGEQLEIPQGAAAAAPMALTTLTQADAGLTLPPATSWLAGVTFSFSGELALAGRLSVAKPSGLADASQVLVVRVRESNGQTQFLLAARARLEGDRLIADTSLPGSSDALEGVRVPGRYLFLQTDTPLAFSVGAVSGVSGSPFASALVTNDRLAIGAVSSSAGRYAQAMPGGGVTLTALDETKRDTGTAAGTVIAGVTSTVDLALLAQPPAVVSVTPADGAASVALSDPVVVRFSEAVAPATVTALAVLLTGPSGPVTASLSLTSYNTVATLRPVAPLDASTAYTVTIDNTITDLAGYALPAKVTAHFTSLSTTPPPAPPAGNLSATIPSGGTSIVSGTQGSAGLHDTVTIFNITQKTTTPALVDPNGSFSASVAVSLRDKLRLQITDPSGNTTVVDIAAFRQVNANGSVSQAVGPDGGLVEGPGGIVVDVPAGAFPDGTVVTLKPVSEAEFPYQFSPEQKADFAYTAGIDLDLGGAKPTRYLNIGFPKPADATPNDRWSVVQAISYGGQMVPGSIDTARVTGSRVMTSSPPCPGVTGSGVFGFLRAARPLGVVYGNVINPDRTLPGALLWPFLVGPAFLQLPATPFAAIMQAPGLFGTQQVLGFAETGFQQLTAPACLPLLSGKISIVSNQVRITVSEDLTETERQVDITNMSRRSTRRFFAPLGAQLSIEGGNSDTFNVEAVDLDGSRRGLSWIGEPSRFVKATVAKASLGATAVRITIRDQYTGETWSSAITPPALDVVAIMPGQALDEFVAEVLDQLGTVTTVPVTVVDCPIGNGNLLVRAQPGTIDPTADEITAYNATVPPEQQLALRSAVSSVTLTKSVAGAPITYDLFSEIASTTATLAMGALLFDVDGDLATNSFAVNVRYRDGKGDVISIPRFHVTVRDRSTGEVIKEIAGQIPPPDKPLFIDVNPPAAAGSVSTPGSFMNIDPRTPVLLVFSVPMNATSIKANLLVFDSNGKKVPGEWRMNADGTQAQFFPEGSLQLGKVYKVSFVGVRTAAGAAMGSRYLLLRTFTPKRIATLKLINPVVPPPPIDPPDPPITDLGLLRQATSSGIKSTLVALTTQTAGLRLHTVDVTTPASPTYLAPGSVGSTPRRLALSKLNEPDTIDVRYTVPLIAQQTSMSCWAASAAMIVAWRDHVVPVDAEIAAGSGYWAAYRDILGLQRDDTIMLSRWQMVPEPPQTFTIEGFAQLLRTYGPLWVAAAVPGTHIRVVTGLYGDGSPDGTLVYINDPWQLNMSTFRLPNSGASYTLTYRQYEEEQRALAVRENPSGGIYVYVGRSANPVVGPGTAAPPKDIAISSAWNLFDNHLAFVDITNPVAPNRIGGKVITANPENPSPFTQKGTFKVQGFAKGVAALRNAADHSVYFAIQDVGLAAVILEKNIPEVDALKRETELLYSGDYQDVIVVGTTVVALNKHFGGEWTLDLFDPNLSLISTISVDNPGVSQLASVGRLKYARAVRYDRDGDGKISPDETFDIVYVGGTAGVTMVNVTHPVSAEVIGSIPLPVGVRQLSVAVDGQSLIAAGWRNGGIGVGVTYLASMYFVDCSNPGINGLVDADHDTRDDRITYEIAYPRAGDPPDNEVTAVHLEAGRGLAFVGTNHRVEVWAVSKDAVAAGNHDPVANAGPDQRVRPADTVTLNGAGSTDPDGDTLSYAWKQTGGPDVVLTGPETATPTFTAPDGGGHLTFQLTVNDGVTNSAADTVEIYCGSQVTLSPSLVPMVVVPGTKQLKVEFGLGGSAIDVTADPDTTYAANPVGAGVPDLAPALGALSAKLGVTVPLADVSVSASGQLTVNTAGLALVRATYKGTDSNYSLVLAGITLKSIAIKPEAGLTELVGILASALGSSKSAPMILVADKNGFILDKGVVLLDDVVFEFGGAGEIGIKDLAQAISPLVEGAFAAALGGAAPAASAVTAVLARLLGAAGTQFLDLEASDTTVATVTDDAPFKGLVQSHNPGLASVIGTLDLGGLGKADDSLFVFVLPQIASATVVPAVTYVDPCGTGTPPNVRTWVETNVVSSAVVPVHGNAATAAALLDRFLPGGLAAWAGTIDREFRTNSPVANLKFRLRGAAAPACTGSGASLSCTLTFSDVSLGFYMPNGIFGLVNTYAESDFAKPGTPGPFDTPILHKGTVGRAPMPGHVEIPLFGVADDPASTVVASCTAVELQKTAKNPTTKINKEVTYDVKVTNRFDKPLTGVTVTDRTYFTPSNSDLELLMQEQTLAIGALAPKEIRLVKVKITAPSSTGIMRNEVSVPGGPPADFSILVLDDQLHIDPRLVLMPVVPGSQNLTVTLDHNDGSAVEDVSADPLVDYIWLGHGLDSTAKGVPDLTKIYNRLNATLVALGRPPLPIQIADISVTAGVLQVNTPGLQVVQARRGTSLKSEYCLVLAGLQLKSIALKGLSAGSLATAVASKLGAEKTPLLLLPNVPGNSFLTQTGLVLLHDAVFEVLGGPATLSFRDVVAALGDGASAIVTEVAAGTGPLAPLFGWAAKAATDVAAGTAGALMLDPLTSSKPTIASLTGNIVSGQASGFSRVRGTLDLGPLGKASDNLLVWVLPSLTSVAIRPNPVTTYVGNPEPPSVRTFSLVSAGNTSEPIQLPGAFSTPAEAADTILPGGLGAWANGAIDRTFTASFPAPNFTFKVKGAFQATCSPAGPDDSGCSIAFTNLELGFDTPLLFTTYTFGIPAIAAGHGDANLFDESVEGLQAGTTGLTSDVNLSLFGLGLQSDNTGRVIVSELGLKKIVTTGVTQVAGGVVVDFTITVKNSMSTPASVTLTDREYFKPAGSMIEQLRNTSTIPVGTMQPKETLTLKRKITAPMESGTLRNEVSVAGSLPASASVNVVADHLLLSPRILIIPVTAGDGQLTATLVPGVGAPSDVTADSGTSYLWLSGGLDTTLPGVPSITAIVTAVNAALRAAGKPEIPFNPATITVTAGVVHATTPGFQVVQARRGPLASDYTLVLAGMQLKEIALRGFSAGELVNAMARPLGLKTNPLLLASAVPGNTWMTTTGQVLLHDATIELFGFDGFTISLRDLVGALSQGAGDVVTAFMAETGPLARLFGWATSAVVDTTAGGLAAQLLDPLTSNRTTVATVTDASGGGWRGKVDAAASGFASITGTLDLGPVGKASDSVFTWVLPSLASVRIDPNPVATYVNNPAPPSVRTLGTVTAGQTLEPLDLPSQVTSVARTLDKFLPGGLAAWQPLVADWTRGTINRTFTSNWPVAGFTLTLTGAYEANCAAGTNVSCSVTFTNLNLEFPVPRAYTAYQFVNPAIASGRAGANDYDLEIVGATGGTTPLWSDVDLQAYLLGQKLDHSGRVDVVSLTLGKAVAGGVTKLDANSTASFAVTVVNRTAATMTGVSVTDTTYFTPSGGAEAVWRTQTLSVGTLQPGESRTVQVTVAAPPGIGVLRNEVTATGATPAGVTLPVVVPLTIQKAVAGGAASVVAGDTARFEITVTNPNDVPAESVTVTDSLFFTAQGTPTESPLGTSTIALGTLAPREVRVIPWQAVAPGQAGTLRNQASLPGVTPVSASIAVVAGTVTPGTRPLINEVVVEPQRDWNDSGAGGDGVPFNATPGSAMAPDAQVTAADQWIEIWTNTGTVAELLNWTLEFTDVSGQAVTVTLGPSNLVAQAANRYVLVKAPGGIDRDSLLTLRDTTNGVVDQLDLRAIQAAIGYAAGTTTESIARIPDGTTGRSVTNFARRAATIGARNQ